MKNEVKCHKNYCDNLTSSSSHMLSQFIIESSLLIHHVSYHIS